MCGDLHVEPVEQLAVRAPEPDRQQHEVGGQLELTARHVLVLAPAQFSHAVGVQAPQASVLVADEGVGMHREEPLTPFFVGQRITQDQRPQRPRGAVGSLVGRLLVDVELVHGGGPLAMSGTQTVGRRVAATLAQTDIYPPHLVQLAERIVGDGVQHEVRCITIKGALRPYENDAGRYLRTGMKLGTGRDVETAIGHRNDIITALKEAYAAAASERVADCAVKIAAARVKMTQLLDEGERLANEKNIGIPFFEGI